MLILRRSNYVITAPGIITLCKRPFSAPVESGLQYCSKHVEDCNVIYYYRIQELCIKLVIETSLYHEMCLNT
jgi:hypothetical protein